MFSFASALFPNPFLSLTSLLGSNHRFNLSKTKMHKFLLTLLLLLSAAVTSSSSADPTAVVYAGCSQSKYEDGSAYQLNVDSLLTSLANAASTSPYAKFTSDTASASSAVHGLFQCRGDLPPSDCQSCVRSAISQLHPTCPSSSGAALQLDGCLVRYGGEPFIGKEETNLLYKKCGPTPPSGYDANLVGMRDEALSAVASAGGTGGTYRVGAAGYVQAAAQCVGDLGAGDCSDCVSNAVGQLKNACGDALSGEVYLGKCFAKYYSSGVYSAAAAAGCVWWLCSLLSLIIIVTSGLATVHQ